jgi:hypothetical protein
LGCIADKSARERARVQTRRTRTAGKVEIPSVDDHVSKLEHMGRETVKKLADVRDAAAQAGIDDFRLPPHVLGGSNAAIETVGAFQQLALAAEQVRRRPPPRPRACGAAEHSMHTPPPGHPLSLTSAAASTGLVCNAD